MNSKKAKAGRRIVKRQVNKILTGAYEEISVRYNRVGPFKRLAFGIRAIFTDDLGKTVHDLIRHYGPEKG